MRTVERALAWQRQESGFTLIELLATILIVALLAMLAIPSFLAAQGQARDGAAKSMAATAQRAAEALALDEWGSYAATSKSALRRREPAIATSRNAGEAYLSAARGTVDSYTLTAIATHTGDKFTIVRNPDGTVERTCRIPSRASPQLGCEHVKGTRGSW